MKTGNDRSILNNFRKEFSSNNRESGQLETVLSADWPIEKNSAIRLTFQNTDLNENTRFTEKFHCDNQRFCSVIDKRVQVNTGNNLDKHIQMNSSLNQKVNQSSNSCCFITEKIHLREDTKLKGRPNGQIVYKLNRHPLQPYEGVHDFSSVSTRNNYQIQNTRSKNFEGAEILGEENCFNESGKIQASMQQQEGNKFEIKVENRSRNPARIPSRIQRLCRRRQNNGTNPFTQINCNNISKDCIEGNGHLQLKTIKKIEKDISITTKKGLW